MSPHHTPTTSYANLKPVALIRVRGADLADSHLEQGFGGQPDEPSYLGRVAGRADLPAGDSASVGVHSKYDAMRRERCEQRMDGIDHSEGGRPVLFPSERSEQVRQPVTV